MLCEIEIVLPALEQTLPSSDLCIIEGSSELKHEITFPSGLLRLTAVN